MSIILNIVTAASRLENLPIVAESIKTELNPYFEVRWFCVPNNDSPFGGKSRNRALRSMKKEGYLYFLDDDNIIYPGFGKKLKKEIEKKPDSNLFLFTPQIYMGKIRECTVNVQEMKLYHIDTAQFVLKTDLLGDIYWIEDKKEGDWKILNDYVNKNKSKPVVVNYPVYYNYLRSKESVKNKLKSFFVFFKK